MTFSYDAHERTNKLNKSQKCRKLCQLQHLEHFLTINNGNFSEMSSTYSGITMWLAQVTCNAKFSSPVTLFLANPRRQNTDIAFFTSCKSIFSVSESWKKFLCSHHWLSSWKYRCFVSQQKSWGSSILWHIEFIRTTKAKAHAILFKPVNDVKSPKIIFKLSFNVHAKKGMSSKGQINRMYQTKTKTDNSRLASFLTHLKQKLGWR